MTTCRVAFVSRLVLLRVTELVVMVVVVLMRTVAVMRAVDVMLLVGHRLRFSFQRRELVLLNAGRVFRWMTI